jgi:hypothetical protein
MIRKIVNHEKQGQTTIILDWPARVACCWPVAGPAEKNVVCP